MTQKQTDYDKAFEQHLYDLKARFDFVTDEEQNIAIQSFRKGCEYGKKQSTADHFRDSTKMMRSEIAMRAMQGFIASGMMPDKMDGKDNYQTLAAVSVHMADALIKELEKEEG